MIQENIFPQLAFGLNNAAGAHAIYIGSDATNKLTLTITTNEKVTFLPGKLVPTSEAANAPGSLLYLDLRALQISEQAFNKITCQAPHWQCKLYASDKLICLTPTQEITLENGTNDSIAITIDGLTIATPPSSASANLHVTYYRVPPAALDTLPNVSFFKVLLQNPPQGH